MDFSLPLSAHLRGAWAGRISGCLLGKAVEVLSFKEGRAGLQTYLMQTGAWPLRDYVPLLPGSIVEQTAAACCRERLHRAEPDDDINYTLLALTMLEEHGTELSTEKVARAWLRLLPAGSTWTAERAAYQTLLNRMDPEFVNGAPPGFDLSECSNHEYRRWIGAQIRTDLYGWVCPGRPLLAAELARADAELSHRDEGVYAAVFIAALGALIPVTGSIGEAIAAALRHLPARSAAAAAVQFGVGLAGRSDAVHLIHERYASLPPVHAVNNLALVAWGLSSYSGSFGATIGDVVAAGLDTDCNGATVGGMLGLAGAAIGESWTAPWRGRIASNLGGVGELTLDEVVARTLEVMLSIDEAAAA